MGPPRNPQPPPLQSAFAVTDRMLSAASGATAKVSKRTDNQSLRRHDIKNLQLPQVAPSDHVEDITYFGVSGRLFCRAGRQSLPSPIIRLASGLAGRGWKTWLFCFETSGSLGPRPTPAAREIFVHGRGGPVRIFVRRNRQTRASHASSAFKNQQVTPYQHPPRFRSRPAPPTKPIDTKCCPPFEATLPLPVNRLQS